MKTLFLAWQSPDENRAWFPIGRLDADIDAHRYLFRYTNGALIAQRDAGFRPLLSFPDFHRGYESGELFSLFQNRVLDPARKDFLEYLKFLDLRPEDADPVEILALT